MQILVFNSGSSSLKFDLMEETEPGRLRRVYGGAFEDAADGTGALKLRSAAIATSPSTPIREPAEAARFVLEWLANADLHGRDLLLGIDACVHRIVHGADMFRAPTCLDDAALAALAKLDALAPLHNPPALSVISAVRERLGKQCPTIGVFDTAYYAELPEAAFRYAVPARWHAEFGVRRYGFHGIAHRYLCQAARARLGPSRSTRRIISLQLGRGCSVTATLGERAVATSMGFTPLEGLVMGTRSGDLDPGALLYVMERAGMSAAQLRDALNKESGLLGISGRSADMRTLLALEASADAAAALAVEVFCRRARHYLGAYMAELGGVDVIVFGGGIGEHSAPVRGRIADGLRWAGVAIDPAINAASVGVAASLAAASSRVAVEVIPVDEAIVIAGEAASLLRAETPPAR